MEQREKRKCERVKTQLKTRKRRREKRIIDRKTDWWENVIKSINIIKTEEREMESERERANFMSNREKERQRERVYPRVWYREKYFNHCCATFELNVIIWTDDISNLNHKKVMRTLTTRKLNKNFKNKTYKSQNITNSSKWEMIMRSNFMRLKFNIFIRSKLWSWDQNSICSWDWICLIILISWSTLQSWDQNPIMHY